MRKLVCEFIDRVSSCSRQLVAAEVGGSVLYAYLFRSILHRRLPCPRSLFRLSSPDPGLDAAPQCPQPPRRGSPVGISQEDPDSRTNDPEQNCDRSLDEDPFEGRRLRSSAWCVDRRMRVAVWTGGM